MTKIVIHPATKVYLDYGDELSRHSGIIIEANGSLMGFQEGIRAADAVARWRHEVDTGGLSDRFDISLGDHITRMTDMNPHGLI